MKNILEIKNLTKIYNKTKKAVNDITLEVKEGDIFGFVGHNGAGKSTTIKSIMGIISFEKGQILVDGKDITKEPIECKKIMHYIPDNPLLFEYLQGYQYLDLIGSIYEVDNEVKKERIRHYAKIFGLDKDLGSIISSYSHGMKQKLSIISALIHEPKLLILDEPFVGLDPVSSHALKNIFKEMCEKGNAIFFSSHVLEVVEKLCNKIAIIKNGEIVVEGLTEDVKGNKSLESIFIELQQ